MKYDGDDDDDDDGANDNVNDMKEDTDGIIFNDVYPQELL